MPREIAFTVVVDVGNNGIMARDIPSCAENPPPTPVVGNMATLRHRETGEFTHHPILLVVTHHPGTTQSPPKELLMAMLDIEQKHTLEKAIGLEGLIVEACDKACVDVMKVIGFRGKEAEFAKDLYESGRDLARIVPVAEMSAAMRTRCKVVQGTTHILFYRKDQLHIRPNTSGDLVKIFVERVRDGRRNVTVGVLEGFKP
jgi:hypothetical protein